jgi:hypothetical protein
MVDGLRWVNENGYFVLQALNGGVWSDVPFMSAEEQEAHVKKGEACCCELKDVRQDTVSFVSVPPSIGFMSKEKREAYCGKESTE